MAAPSIQERIGGFGKPLLRLPLLKRDIPGHRLSPEEEWATAESLPRDKQARFVDRKILNVISQIKGNDILHETASYRIMIDSPFLGLLSYATETILRIPIPIDGMPATLPQEIRIPLIQHLHERRRHPARWEGKPSLGLSLTDNGPEASVQLTVDTIDNEEGIVFPERNGAVYHVNNGRQGIGIRALTIRGLLYKEQRTGHYGHKSKALDSLQTYIDSTNAFALARDLIVAANAVIAARSQSPTQPQR